MTCPETAATDDPHLPSSPRDTAPGQTAAVWVPDYDADRCMCCRSARFSLLNRRHHCRKCGKVVCGPCSMQRVRLPDLSDKDVRVCNLCVEAGDAAATAVSQMILPEPSTTTPGTRLSRFRLSFSFCFLLSSFLSSRFFSSFALSSFVFPLSYDMSSFVFRLFAPLSARPRDESVSSTTSSRRSGRLGNVTVVSDYHPSAYDDDMLELRAGEVVRLLAVSETGLWRGRRVRDGREGSFPFRYVSDVEEDWEA